MWALVVYFGSLGIVVGFVVVTIAFIFLGKTPAVIVFFFSCSWGMGLPAE